MVSSANLGFPRVGANRELKKALEAYWSGDHNADALTTTANALRRSHWSIQQDAGIATIPVGDFSLYDGVLDTCVLVGAIPARFQKASATDSAPEADRERYFAMARGNGQAQALEMTKWFDTNYHYLVPEFDASQPFRLCAEGYLDAVRDGLARGIPVRPVLLGPVTFLLLGRRIDAADPLALLPGLLPVYGELLAKLLAIGIDWVQIDEPALVQDLPRGAAAAYRRAYDALHAAAPELRLMLTTYFGGLGENRDLALSLPVAGLHLDLVRAPEELEATLVALATADDTRVLSLGLVDGRNVWRTDLDRALVLADRAVAALGRDRLQVAPSCSLLHSPFDLDAETGLDPELRSWLAFATQKLDEVATICRALNEGRDAVADTLAAARAAIASRLRSPRTRNPAVRHRPVTTAMHTRGRPFAARLQEQRSHLGLPDFPTTTIGSFPQTPALRQVRAAHRAGRLDDAGYDAHLLEQTADCIRRQEALGLDVLVHGEFERNDMVEYFGELLDGVAVTRRAWVQSYGSRCVKPPIIYGDVSRPAPMTVAWWQRAQALTARPVKGMLTGPITLLQWAFVRDDQPRSETARQLALAVRDEVRDLEAAGCAIVQVDEPALREGLPLRRADHAAYLRWAVDAFRLATAGAADRTQIHTHMCYCEFGDILPSIAELDADVISIETSRSHMALLADFLAFQYPNDIGPGVYDIHSPRIPTEAEIVALLRRAMEVLPPERLWVNPDCGLKTRRWPEVEAALRAMVDAAQALRGASVPVPAG